jgi:hypothetical protein
MALPLFEWKISEIVTNFPSNYEVHIFPSPWRARFGDSFDDDSYLYKNISVLLDRRGCYNEDINLVIRRAQKDEALEHVWLNIYKNISWLFGWSLIEIFLSILYIWWFMVWHRHSFGKAISLTMLAVFIFLNLIPRLAGPLFPRYSTGIVDCFHGTITFDAVLSEIHYETPIILLIGILLEFGALVTMLYHIGRSVADRKRPQSVK